MARKNNALPEEQQAKMIELLNRRLADAGRSSLDRYRLATAVGKGHIVVAPPDK